MSSDKKGWQRHEQAETESVAPTASNQAPLNILIAKKVATYLLTVDYSWFNKHFEKTCWLHSKFCDVKDFSDGRTILSRIEFTSAFFKSAFEIVRR